MIGKPKDRKLPLLKYFMLLQFYCNLVLHL